MESLLSNPMAPAVVIVGAILVLVLLWKALKVTLKVAALLVLVALIILAVFWLGEIGVLGS